MTQNIPKRWDIEKSAFDAYEIKSLKTVETHWHSHFLLNLFTSGNGVQQVNGESHSVCKGSIIIISPLDFHKNIVYDRDRVSVRAVKFSNKFFFDYLNDICAIEDFPIITSLSEEDFETANTLFSLLLKEQNKKGILGTDKFSKSLIEQLVILALRSVKKREKNTSSGITRKSLEYIHNNFRQDIRISDVASYVGYSPNYLSSEFKKETGVQFQKYLRDLRLDFAYRLLKLSNLSVTEVCYESGFRTLSHFSQVFKEKYGITPEKEKSR